MKVTSSDGICTASLPLSQFSFNCETPPAKNPAQLCLTPSHLPFVRAVRPRRSPFAYPL